jgi:hypothetical protein
VPIIDPSLRQELNLDGSPNSLQRVELAIYQRFESHAALSASPEDVASLLDYLRPIYQRYAGCQPVPGEPTLLRDRAGETIDLAELLRRIYVRNNGQVLFSTCYERLSCIPHD